MNEPLTNCPVASVFFECEKYAERILQMRKIRWRILRKIRWRTFEKYANFNSVMIGVGISKERRQKVNF